MIFTVTCLKFGAREFCYSDGILSVNATAIRQNQEWIATKMLDRSIGGDIATNDIAVNQSEQHFKNIIPVVEKFIVEVVKK